MAGGAWVDGGRTADRAGRRRAGTRLSFDFDRARRATPARLAVGRAGSRPPTAATLAFLRDHAAARDAVWSEWSDEFVGWLEQTGFLIVRSCAPDRATYVRQPPLGRRLPAAAVDAIRAASPAGVSVQIVLSDGLSPRASEAHFARVYEGLRRHLDGMGTIGGLVAVRNGRVAVADVIGLAVGADLVVLVIGERPGLGAADSLGCYLTWRPRVGTTDAERKCVSNVRTDGLDPGEAGAVVAGVGRRILAARRSDVGLGL